MKKYLFINTINDNLPSFSIFLSDGSILAKSIFYNKLEKLTNGLEIFFKKHKISTKDIKGVIVINGPGSFTSSRAGITLANSFNFLFNIPVLGVKDEIDGLHKIINNNIKKLSSSKNNITASVYYNREPNITVNH